MAGNDPTHAARVVSVELPARDRTFLRELITMARDGVREELLGLAHRGRGSAHLKREEEAYERLLTGLSTGRIEVDPDVRATLVALAEVVDASNEYPRVAFEHEALGRLIGILGRGA